MRTINIEAVEKRTEFRKNEVKPDPVITRRRPAEQLIRKIGEAPINDAILEHREEPLSEKEILLSEYFSKLKDVKNDRAILSNKARHRWQDGADKSELKELYLQINSLTDEGARIYDLVNHIEKYGELPQDPGATSHMPSAQVLEMKERKRQLINQRDKLRRNLKPNAKQPANSEKRSHWEQSLAVLDAEYNDLVERLKRVNYDTRD